MTATHVEVSQMVMQHGGVLTESGSPNKLAKYGCNWHILFAVTQRLLFVITIRHNNNTSEWKCNLYTQSATTHAAI